MERTVKSEFEDRQQHSEHLMMNVSAKHIIAFCKFRGKLNLKSTCFMVILISVMRWCCEVACTEMAAQTLAEQSSTILIQKW